MFSNFRYIFFGGKESPFAEIILNNLRKAGLEPAAIFDNARAPLDINKLKSLRADLFVVASFGKILKREVLDIPPMGVIGVHPSLLPKYRGASPIQSVILNDEKETGVALFFIDEKVDHGPILSEKRIAISEKDNYKILQEKLAKLGSEMLIEFLLKIARNEIIRQPAEEIQDESAATLTKKFITEDAFIDLSFREGSSSGGKSTNQKENWLKIKALNPEPGTYTILKLKNGKDLRLKILEADFKDDKLELKTVQPEGKKPMPYTAFLNGYKDKLLQ